MPNNTPIFLKRFPIPNPSGFASREKKVAFHVNALWRSQAFFRKWTYGTIIATRRGMPQHCGNPECRRSKACTGQMQPVIYSDSELSCTPPCLAVNRTREYREALRLAVRDIESLVREHGLAEGLKRARRIGRWSS